MFITGRYRIVFKLGGERHAREEFQKGENPIPLTNVSVAFITVLFPQILRIASDFAQFKVLTVVLEI